MSRTEEGQQLHGQYRKTHPKDVLGGGPHHEVRAGYGGGKAGLGHPPAGDQPLFPRRPQESSPSSRCTRLPCPGHPPGTPRAAGAPVREGGLRCCTRGGWLWGLPVPQGGGWSSAQGVTPPGRQGRGEPGLRNQPHLLPVPSAAAGRCCLCAPVRTSRCHG